MNTSGVAPIHGGFYGNIFGAALANDGFCRSIFAEAPFARQVYGDFDHFNGAGSGRMVGTTGYAGWTTTIVGASTLVMADDDQGILQLTSSAVENEGIQIQHDGESFLPADGNDIWFECEVSGNDVTEVDWFMGLCLTDTSIVASNPADLIGFWSLDGDPSIHFEVSATAGAGAAVDTLVDFADDTAVRLGFHVSSNKAGTLSRVTPYINGTANTTATVVTAANIPEVEMAVAFAILNGEAVANRLDINWYRIAQLV